MPSEKSYTCQIRHPVKFEHGGNIYNAGGQVSDWLDMSANINPLGISEAVQSSILNNIDGLVHYPDPTARELKSAISTRYRNKFENILTLNGAAEFFYLFFNIVRPKRVMIAVPSFSEYERAAIAANCRVTYFVTDEKDNFDVDFKRMNRIIVDEDIECVVLANPNNPTGNILNLKDISTLLRLVNFVVIDESFIDFIGDEYSARPLINENENLIIVQSMTKFFAIPGLRLGFAIANESLVKRLELGKDVWNVNYLAQKAGVAALADEDYMNETRNWLYREREYVHGRLKNISKINFFGPTVNFVLIKFETEKIALNVMNEFKINKILLRSCANFRGLDGRYIRMAIRNREENDRSIDLIETILGGM